MVRAATSPERDLRELWSVSLQVCWVAGHHFDVVAGLTQVTIGQFRRSRRRDGSLG
jgi:hypothetical protein